MASRHDSHLTRHEHARLRSGRESRRPPHRSLVSPQPKGASFMSKSVRTVLTAVGATVSLACLTAPAMAQNAWQADHPRRAQVDARWSTRTRASTRRSGQARSAPGRRRRLHAADQRVRAHEQQMAGRHGGHITQGEQARLNAEEDRVSRRIGAYENGGALGARLDLQRRRREMTRHRDQHHADVEHPPGKHAMSLEHVERAAVAASLSPCR